MHQGAAEALKWLERRGSKRVVAGMARYGIPSDGAFGVPMGMLLEQAKRLAQSGEAGCRWVGKDALRELASPKVRARLARRAG